MTDVHQRRKMCSFALIPCFSDHLFFVSDLQAWQLTNLFKISHIFPLLLLHLVFSLLDALDEICAKDHNGSMI